MDDADAIRALRKLSLQHNRGIICPALMWGEVLRVVAGPDPVRVLSLASAECRSALRAIYNPRPSSLRNEGRGDELRRLVEVVEAWCQGAAAEPRAAPDAGR